MSFAALARKRAPGRYGYLALPGTSGCYASTPDSAAVSVTGDIDVRLKVLLPDYTPVATAVLLGKSGTATHMSYVFYLNTNGKLTAQASVTGSALSSATASVATGITDGALYWIRFTRTSADGVVKFYKSSDGSSWTQIGTDQSTTTGAIFDSDHILEVGASSGGTSFPAVGHFYRAQIRNTVADDGSGIVFDADFTDTGRTFNEAGNNAVVTINGATAVASVHP